MIKLFKLILLCLLAMTSISAHTVVKDVPIPKAQSSFPLGSSENPIKIGVMLTPPFAYKAGDTFHGLVIDFWQYITNSKDWHFTYMPTSFNYTEAVKALQAGKYDIILGNFSTTFDRNHLVDFSEPFIINKVSILTTVKNVGPMQRFLNALTNLSPVLMMVMALFVFFSLLFWFLEARTQNYSMTKSLFSTSVAMISGDVVDKPSSNLNRIMFVCILITGMVLQAVIIASMTDSAMSNERLNDPFVSKADLVGKTFVVVKGSYYVDIIKTQDANVFEFDGDSEDAAKYYVTHSDQYAGFISEHLLAKRYVKQFKDLDDRLIVSKLNLRFDLLSFLFRKDFPYKDSVNLGLYYMQDTNLSYSICSNYIGREAELCVF